jgi:hypothetical protein
MNACALPYQEVFHTSAHTLMAIEVTCPNGHKLQIKEKYAGKSGLCPRCQARIDVPALGASEELIDLVARPAAPQGADAGREATPTAPAHDPHDALADDEPAAAAHAPSRGGESLLSSAVIRHRKVCPQCYQVVPIWYARCTHCDFYFSE